MIETSIQERIRTINGQPPSGIRLRRFRSKESSTLPIAFSDYLQLVDWTGRQLRSGKRGSINPNLPPILTRLNIDPEAWIIAMRPKGNVFGRALGKLNHLRLHARALGQEWIKGLREAERLFG